MNLTVCWKSGAFDLDGLARAAERLARELERVFGSPIGEVPRGVVALQGEMGAGKTTLVQALCQAWKIEEDAVSPTFGLVQCYRRNEDRIYHLDLYRLRDESEAWDLGLTEYFDADALNFVEWPEQAPGLLPKDAVLLQVQVDGLQHNGLRELILSLPASMQHRM
jgi:tRNA threonylcarbamoyladenosine biosynthesis protein TsaE